MYKTRTYISNNQTETLIHNNSLQLANILHVTHLAKYEKQTFHVRYQPPSLEVMILTLPKIEVIALGNGVVPSFVLFKWLIVLQGQVRCQYYNVD